jgi:hypothetical protein
MASFLAMKDDTPNGYYKNQTAGNDMEILCLTGLLRHFVPRNDGRKLTSLRGTKQSRLLQSYVLLTNGK